MSVKQNKILVKQNKQSTTPAIRCGFENNSIAIWQDIWVELLSESKNGVNARITPANKKEIHYMISGPNTDHKAKSLDVVISEFDLIAMQLGL